MLKTLPSRVEIFGIIREEIEKILKDRGETVSVRGSDTLIEGLGFSSLDLAHLLLELDARLEVDPFESFVSITTVRSVDDMIDVYEKFFAQEMVS